MAPRFERRLFVTLVAVVVVSAAQFIPAPGLHVGDAFPAGETFALMRRFRLLGLGVLPYLSAAALWLLLSGMVPALRRLREGTADERRSFDAGILWLTLLLATAQSASLAVYALHLTVGGPGDLRVIAPLLVASQVTGTFALLAVAELVTRYGLGNGVAVVFLGSSLLPEATAACATQWRWFETHHDLFGLPLLVVLAGGLIAGAVWFLGAAQRLPLEPLDESARAADAGSDAPTLRLRLNLPGSLPGALAFALITLVFAFPIRFATVVHGTPWIYWSVLFVLTIVVAYVMVPLAYDSERVSGLLGRFGYRVRGVAPADLGRHLDRIIDRQLPLALLVLLALEALPSLLDRAPWFTHPLAGRFSLSLIVTVAIVMEVVRHARAVRDLDTLGVPAADAAAPATPGALLAWTEVFESDTEIECELAVHVLGRAGVTAVLLSNRMIPAVATLALWEWTLPRYPSLVLHRRLGGGRVVVMVPTLQAAQAHDVLARVGPAEKADE